MDENEDLRGKLDSVSNDVAKYHDRITRIMAAHNSVSSLITEVEALLHCKNILIRESSGALTMHIYGGEEGRCFSHTFPVVMQSKIADVLRMLLMEELQQKREEFLDSLQ